MANTTFGLSGAHISHATPSEAIDRCVELSIDAVEFFTAEYTVEECRQIRRKSLEAGIAVDYHAPWEGRHDLGISSDDEAFLDLEQSVARAHLMGARHIVCHLGTYDADRPDGRERSLSRVIDVTRSLVPTLEDTGLCLCFEDNTLCHDPNPLGDCPQDFSELFDAVKSNRVGMAIDTGHAHVTGHTRAYLETFGRRVHYFHLADNDGIGDLHQPPSAGSIDWPTLFDQMAYYGAAGAFAIEFNEEYVPTELPVFRELAAAHDWRTA
jgi:sugar phosphate isomerase/epimerase